MNFICTEKVQAEIDRVIGQSRQPSMEDRANIPYTDAVIHEILRIGTIAPLALPHSTNKEVQLGSYTIPKVTSQKTICSDILCCNLFVVVKHFYFIFTRKC